MTHTIFDFYTHEFTVEGDIVVATFQTKSGTYYRAYFYPAHAYFDYIPEDSLISMYGYNFGFTKVGDNEDKKEGLDMRVMNTIVNIVNEFYTDAGEKSILIFNCADDWGKDKKIKRAARFELWFEFVKAKFRFKKFDKQIDLPDFDELGNIALSTEYYSLIIHEDNIDCDLILEHFQLITEERISKFLPPQ